MRILFFIVNGAKFWMFRDTINELKSRGHKVEFMIVKKDVMEELLKREGWDYVNIMPKGRNIKYLPKKLGAIIMAFITFWKIFWYTFGKKYDLFVTTDVLAFVGWLRRIPTLIFFDDDLEHMPEYSPIISAGTKLVTPHVSEFPPFEHKQIKYKGNHEWAYINPKYFKPDINVVKKFNPKMDRYFLVRLVGWTATHDAGKDGINDKKLDRLISILSKYGKVYLNVEKERALPDKYEQYRLSLHPYEIHHAMYYADLFVGDGHTMNSEAGLMGVPSVRINDFVGHCKYMEEEDSYGLTFGYRTDQYEEALSKIDELARKKDIKKEWAPMVKKWANDHIDSTKFYIDLIESYNSKKR